MLASPAPGRHLGAMHAHAMQKLLQRILRMGLLRLGRAGFCCMPIDRPDGVPLRVGQILVEIGEHNHPPWQARHRAKQARHRRRRGDDAGGHDEAVRRMRGPAGRDMIEQPVAPLGGVDAAALRQLPWPPIEQQVEERKGPVPMFGQFLALRLAQIVAAPCARRRAGRASGPAPRRACSPRPGRPVHPAWRAPS